jgi:predicted lipoprotein with Yx(FWY)xxD motif
MRRLTVVLLLLVVVGATALVVTEAGGGASNTAQTGAQTGRGLHGGGRGVPSPPAAADSAIDVRSTPLGTILVDAKGRTLYLFEADRAHMSNCSGACVSVWPPLTASVKPQATGGALAAKIATITIGGGRRQVTYNGHPLYYYVGDQKPGHHGPRPRPVRRRVVRARADRRRDRQWLARRTPRRPDRRARWPAGSRELASAPSSHGARATSARALTLVGVGIAHIQQSRSTPTPRSPLSARSSP